MPSLPTLHQPAIRTADNGAPVYHFDPARTLYLYVCVCVCVECVTPSFGPHCDWYSSAHCAPRTVKRAVRGEGGGLDDYRDAVV